MRMNLYVASSWRNRFQPGVVARLRAEGHEVYDFRNPAGAGENTGFGWQQIDVNWRFWTPERYKQALTHAVAQRGFEADERGMIRADACVLVLPSGRSAHVEFGWMVGRGKLGYVLLSEEGFEPDLMYLLTPHDRICTSLDELVAKVAADNARLVNGGMRPAEASAVLGLHTTPEGGVTESATLVGVEHGSWSSAAAPPVMPHVVTSPPTNPAAEVVVEGGTCTLEAPLPVFVKLFRLKTAIGQPEPAEPEYGVVALASGRSLYHGTLAYCQTALVAAGYEPAPAAVERTVRHRHTLVPGDVVWVNPAEAKKFDEWFDSIKHLLP